jgi:hypothetical protein
MLASKLLRIKFRVKHKIDNYIRENSDEIGFEFIFKFLVNHYCISGASFEDLMNNNRSKKRIIIVWTYYILFWIISLRFLLLAVINKPWIWNLFADPIYATKNSNLIALNVAICGILATIAKTLFMIFENVPQSKTIIKLYSTNRNQYGLRNRYYYKFCLKSKFMAKFFLGPFFRISVFALTFFYMSLIIKAYFDSDFEFPIIKSILSTTVLLIWLKHCFAVVWAAFVILYIISLHLKYNFRQLKDIMKGNLKSGNLVLLMDAIREHNHYSKLTLEWNQVFKYALFTIYFLTTPMIDVLVYLAVSEVNTVLRIFYILLGISFSFVIFIANYISSSLSSSTHDFTSDLYTFLTSKRIPVQHKLKISSFIEKLCGPVIGYYCYDLFAFTNYEFYEFISFVFCTYFLLNSLLFDV